MMFVVTAKAMLQVFLQLYERCQLVRVMWADRRISLFLGLYQKPMMKLFIKTFSGFQVLNIIEKGSTVGFGKSPKTALCL